MSGEARGVDREGAGCSGGSWIEDCALGETGRAIGGQRHAASDDARAAQCALGAGASINRHQAGSRARSRRVVHQQRAGVHRRAAGVGVGGGERETARAVHRHGSGAGQASAERQVVRTTGIAGHRESAVEREAIADRMIRAGGEDTPASGGDRNASRTEGAVVPDTNCARAQGRPAGVIIDSAQGERAGAFLVQSDAAMDGPADDHSRRIADGDCLGTAGERERAANREKTGPAVDRDSRSPGAARDGQDVRAADRHGIRVIDRQAVNREIRVQRRRLGPCRLRSIGGKRHVRPGIRRIRGRRAGGVARPVGRVPGGSGAQPVVRRQSLQGDAHVIEEIDTRVLQSLKNQGRGGAGGHLGEGLLLVGESTRIRRVVNDAPSPHGLKVRGSAPTITKPERQRIARALNRRKGLRDGIERTAGRTEVCGIGSRMRSDAIYTEKAPARRRGLRPAGEVSGLKAPIDD